MNSKRGNILTENIIFIVLNVIFLSILIGFILLQSGGRGILEQNYAKQFALLIDAAPANAETTVTLNMQDAMNAKEKGIAWDKVVSVAGNTIIVKLSEKGGSKYYFFNNVKVGIFPDSSLEKPENANYIIKIEPIGK